MGYGYTSAHKVRPSPSVRLFINSCAEFWRWHTQRPSPVVLLLMAAEKLVLQQQQRGLGVSMATARQKEKKKETYRPSVGRTCAGIPALGAISTFCGMSRGRTWAWTKVSGCVADRTASPATGTGPAGRKWPAGCCSASARPRSGPPIPWCWSLPARRRCCFRRLRLLRRHLLRCWDCWSRRTKEVNVWTQPGRPIRVRSFAVVVVVVRLDGRTAGWPNGSFRLRPSSRRSWRRVTAPGEAKAIAAWLPSSAPSAPSNSNRAEESGWFAAAAVGAAGRRASRRAEVEDWAALRPTGRSCSPDSNCIRRAEGNAKSWTADSEGPDCVAGQGRIRCFRRGSCSRIRSAKATCWASAGRCCAGRCRRTATRATPGRPDVVGAGRNGVAGRAEAKVPSAGVYPPRSLRRTLRARPFRPSARIRNCFAWRWRSRTRCCCLRDDVVVVAVVGGGAVGAGGDGGDASAVVVVGDGGGWFAVVACSVVVVVVVVVADGGCRRTCPTLWKWAAAAVEASELRKIRRCWLKRRKPPDGATSWMSLLRRCWRWPATAEFGSWTRPMRARPGSRPRRASWGP